MLTTVFAVGTIAGGLWLGFTTPATARTVAALIAGAVFFFASALGFYGWLCDATIPDMLLFRDVPGQYFCNGRLTLLAYALVIAAPIVGARAIAARRSTPNA